MEIIDLKPALVLVLRQCVDNKCRFANMKDAGLFENAPTSKATL